MSSNCHRYLALPNFASFRDEFSYCAEIGLPHFLYAKRGRVHLTRSESMLILVITQSVRAEVQISTAARQLKFKTEFVGDIEDALAKLHNFEFQAIIFDVGVADLEEFRRRSQIFQTERAPCLIILGEAHQVPRLRKALKDGAGEFIIRPFSPSELELRLGLALSKAKTPKKAQATPLQISYGPLRLELASRRIYSAGDELALTPRERAVLSVLIEQQEVPIPKKKLAERVFCLNDDAQPRAVETYVHRLRKKLAPYHIGIINERGLGYRLDVQQTL